MPVWVDFFFRQRWLSTNNLTMRRHFVSNWQLPSKKSGPLSTPSEMAVTLGRYLIIVGDLGPSDKVLKKISDALSIFSIVEAASGMVRFH